MHVLSLAQGSWNHTMQTALNREQAHPSFRMLDQQNPPPPPKIKDVSTSLVSAMLASLPEELVSSVQSVSRERGLVFLGLEAFGSLD